MNSGTEAITFPSTPFDLQACTRCGACFEQCPQLHLPHDRAVRAIEALIARDVDGAADVLYHCTTCFSCNLLCPHDCHPYQLILANWNALYRRRGAPPIYELVCPTRPGNIWEMLFALAPAREVRRLDRWMDAAKQPKTAVLLVGNLAHLVSFILEESALLDHFTPLDLVDQWELGGYLYQGGYLDVVRRIGERAARDFTRWGVQTVVPVLDAVHWMMTAVHPREMGVHFPQRIVNFHEWLLERLDEGAVTFTRPVDLTVTVHDNCFSKAGGGRYWDPPREILRRAGCQIVEMAHHRARSLCCGFGHGASWTRNVPIPFDILRTARIKFREAEATGASALISYCGGCLYLLWAAKVLFKSPLKVLHTLEVARLAMGEPVDITHQRVHVARAWDVIAIITYKLVAGLVRPNFWIRAISFDDRPLDRSKRYPLLQLLRRLLAVPLVQELYRLVFRGLLRVLATRGP